MEEIYKLDKKDRKILHELDKNARQPNSEIGRKVGLSKEVVKYRIDRMVESGLIVRFYTVVNYFRLGISKHKLYLRLKDVDHARAEEIGRYFRDHEKTEWVVTSTGSWDMVVGFLVENINEFDDEIQNVMNRFSANIQHKAVTTTLYLAHHIREFLTDTRIEERKRIVYHTSADPKVRVELIDLKLLRLVTNNARMPVIDMARMLETTPRVIQYRLKRMEKLQVILAYKAHLEPKKMGYNFCKAIVYLTSATKERLDQFVSYCSSLPQAVWPQRVMGAWDFELDFELEGYDKFQSYMFDIKEKFPDIINNYEFLIVSKEFKLDFFPGAARETKQE